MSIETLIHNQLTAHLAASHVEIVDFSAEHAGHNIEAGKGGTHIRITVVSAQFKGISSVGRHRLVYEALKEALAAGVHALTIKAYSPEEWQVLHP